MGVVDEHGVEITHKTFENTAAGYLEAVDLLTAHGVDRVGVEGSAKWGAHVAVALFAAGFDAREVPASRSAAQRRSRRLGKTDAVDAVAAARALLAEPTPGPAQTLEIYDPLVAKIEAVLEHRRDLVAARALLLHHVGDQIAKLPSEIRDQLVSAGKIESRLRRLEAIDPGIATTLAGAYRLEWLQAFIDQDRTARREIRRLEGLIGELLDEHGTTLRDEPGVGPIAAATLLCEVGDPRRFDRESKFARWSGIGPVALSSGEGSSVASDFARRDPPRISPLLVRCSGLSEGSAHVRARPFDAPRQAVVVGRAEVRDLVEDPHWGGDHERGGCPGWGGSLHGVEAAQGGQGRGHRGVAGFEAGTPQQRRRFRVGPVEGRQRPVVGHGYRAGGRAGRVAGKSGLGLSGPIPRRVPGDVKDMLLAIISECVAAGWTTERGLFGARGRPAPRLALAAPPRRQRRPR